MRRNNKQITTTFIICGLLLIGVVYAILQANLQINGTAKIQANTWDIHFDNIQVNENSVSIGENDSQATIDPENNCKVDFEVTLSIPGDFYEFTIDVVNAGTIDGMIGELNKTLKVNNEVVSETPDYLNYSVTYADGVEIENNHKIETGTTETYLVRLEFKTDIEELPEATTITTSLEPQYLQADSSATIVHHFHSLYDVLKTEVNSGNGYAGEYTGEHKDSFTTNGTEKIYYWYSRNNTSSINTILDKWNVIFGGFCWQMYRTTDTGGVKLLYNGIPEEGKCVATGEGQQIGESVMNSYYSNPVAVGYMYNATDAPYIGTVRASEGSIFGNNISYENGYYSLIDTVSAIDKSHHYTCNNTTGICEQVRYYFYYEIGYNENYILLSGGIDAEQAINNALNNDNMNTTDSTIKTYIDTWYRSNLLNYTSYLEDAIFCSDRHISNYGGWNPNNGGLTSRLHYGNFNGNLICTNITDQFSVSNSKAKLTYPIGLLTYPEAYLMDYYAPFHEGLLKTGNSYWLGSPIELAGNRGVWHLEQSTGGYSNQMVISFENGVRPVISLKPGTMYRYGDGSKNNPYIIE